MAALNAQEISALADEYFNSDDAKRRAAIARLILGHFLECRDGPGFARAIARLDRDGFIRAFQEAVDEGANVESIAAASVGPLGSGPVAEALKTIIKRDRSRFPAVLDAVHGSPAVLQTLLGTAVDLGLDITPGLRALKLRHDGDVHVLRDWAQRGVDMTSIAPALRQGFGRDRATAVLSSSALSFSHLHRGELAEFGMLVSHENRNVRWGAARALSEFLLAHPQSGELVDFLALALSDADADVRSQAFLGLETVRKAGHALTPTPAGLEKVLDGLDRSEVLEIVHGWVVRDKAMAASVRDCVRKRGGHARLLAICEDVVAGVHTPPCPICSNLNDFECAGQEEDLPKEARMLVPDDAEERRCPQCGTRYHYAWDEMYSDEFGSHGTYDVRRLSPPPGSKSLRELRDDIAHPAARTRKESAGELTNILVAEGRWEELAGLLRNPAKDVRTRTLMALKAASVDVAPLVPALRERLDEDDDDVQHAASTLLARQSVRVCDIDGLRRLLARDARMVRWAAITTLEDSAKAQSFDLRPFAEDLRALSKHPDDFVHESAKRALALVKGADGPTAGDLASPNLTVRKNASDHFANQALLGKDISAAAVPLAMLLEDADFDVRRNAYQALDWAADEFDITAALPVFNRLLKAGRECDQILRILQTMQVRGGQSIAGVLDGVVAALPVARHAVGVLEVLYERGTDVSSAETVILGMLEAPKLEELHDRLVTLLVRQWLKTGMTDRVERLAAHPRDRVRKVVARARFGGAGDADADASS